MRYLHGIHDAGGEHLHGDKPGWTLVTEQVGINPDPVGGDYRAISDRGIGVVLRINHGYGRSGTIPLAKDYAAFARSVALKVRRSSPVWGVIIGNEPNLRDEWPNLVPITPEQYAECFNLCRQEIKALLPDMKVIPAAMAPYNIDSGDWIRYLFRVLSLIDDCDAINIHAYTRSMNPADITSDAPMGGDLGYQFKGFRTYQDALISGVPGRLRHLPAIITEFDVYGPWLNQDTGVIQAMYKEVNQWNEQQGTQKILFSLCFRWLAGINHVDWGIEDKPLLQNDFRAAVKTAYPSPVVSTQAVPQEQQFMPSISTGASVPTQPPAQPQATKREFDPRLKERGVSVDVTATHDLAAGKQFWRVVNVRWFDESEAGGRHHIYVEALDVKGEPLPAVPFVVSWPGGAATEHTKRGRGFDAGNFAMSPSRNEFSVSIQDGASEKVQGIGMGADTPGGWNSSIHTSTLVTFQRTVAQAQPQQPTPITPPKVTPMPTLAHPVQNPAFRGISQGWKARPEYYSQFKVDGVPLQGHNGLDFRTPIGSIIVAVDAGRVVEVADESPKGYGKYIKLSHVWGESVYAHLNEQHVQLGETVSRGEIIGTSGNTGNSTGPHLHFGMRVSPFNRRDGMGGYSDPSKYLTNITGSAQPASDNWNRAWPIVLKFEGGLSTDRNDPGNYRPDGTFVGTRWGISALNHPHVDIVNLTKEDALKIYHSQYWLKSGADKLPWPLCLVHFDAFVQNEAAATRFLQASGGNPVLYMAERIDWYTTANTWEHHGKGWMRRCATLLVEVAKSKP